MEDDEGRLHAVQRGVVCDRVKTTIGITSVDSFECSCLPLFMVYITCPKSLLSLKKTEDNNCNPNHKQDGSLITRDGYEVCVN